MKIIISFLLLLSYNSTYANILIGHSPVPPVELTSFAGHVENSYVHLFWTTADEFNNKGFVVERAIQIGQWHEIYFIKGKGTTVEPQKYEFKDALINIAAEKYYYRLKQIDFDGTFIYSDEIEISLKPINATLFANYPNPFNPSTKIKFTLFVDNRVKINIYNTVGQLIETLVDKEMESGYHEVNFDASRLASGVYLYQLQAGSFVETKKMVLLR
jgi:hypothetical protein